MKTLAVVMQKGLSQTFQLGEQVFRQLQTIPQDDTALCSFPSTRALQISKLGTPSRQGSAATGL